VAVSRVDLPVERSFRVGLRDNEGNRALLVLAGPLLLRKATWRESVECPEHEVVACRDVSVGLVEVDALD
jgi:hypothetical protein